MTARGGGANRALRPGAGLLFGLCAVAGAGTSFAAPPLHSLLPRPRPMLPGVADPSQAPQGAVQPAVKPGSMHTGKGSGSTLAVLRSLQPPARPRSYTPRVVAPVAPAADAATDAAADAATAGPVRPRPRPTGAARVPVVLVTLARPSELPVLASLSPPGRPDWADRLKTVTASLPMQPPEGGTAPESKGGLCGDPAIQGRMIAPIRASNPQCGLDDGVLITAIAGVRLDQPATLDCPTAQALSSWVRDAVIPAVGRLGGGLASISIPDTYACRPRNNLAGNRISEHGRGHAVDIAALVLANGTEINVLRDWGRGRQGKVLKTIRAAACGPFTTVLGPGSDRFHRNHLHVDTARGRGPYCR